MENCEPIEIDLCSTCRNEPECLMEGFFNQQTCDEYEELSLEELRERDEFIRAIMVGSCPRCDSENTCDCENDPKLKDPTVGHCLDCEMYWCLDCGYQFKKVTKGSQCPHWAICQECSAENRYLDEGEFINKICPTCEHYDAGCLLDDPSTCEKEDEFLCPYHVDVSECEKIEKLRKQG